jgi:hypothetical protein
VAGSFSHFWEWQVHRAALNFLSFLTTFYGTAMTSSPLPQSSTEFLKKPFTQGVEHDAI